MSIAVSGKIVWGRARGVLGVVSAAVFATLVLAGCSGDDGGEPGDDGGGKWSNVTHISQVDGTWKAPSNVGPYTMQQGITATQSFTDYTITFDAAAKTMTSSGSTTTTFSGNITDAIWSSVKSNLQSNYSGLDGVTFSFNDAAHSCTQVNDNFSVAVPENFTGSGYQINQNGTKLKIVVSGAGGYEIIYTKQ
jgi:hypothetical protein